MWMDVTRVGSRRLCWLSPRMEICSIVSRKVTQLSFQISFPCSPAAERLGQDSRWHLLHGPLLPLWQLCSDSGMFLPTFKAGLKDALEVRAIIISTQPQLLVHFCLGQAGSRGRFRGIQVCWVVEELGVRVFPLVHFSCRRRNNGRT